MIIGVDEGTGELVRAEVPDVVGLAVAGDRECRSAPPLVAVVTVAVPSSSSPAIPFDVATNGRDVREALDAYPLADPFVLEEVLVHELSRALTGFY